MEDNPAPTGRTLMDATTFKDNFGDKWPNETHLFYEVEVWKDDAWDPEEGRQGFLRNQSCVTLGRSTGGSPEWKRVEVLVHRRELEGADTLGERRHAELCFLDRVRSWHLDKGKQYRLTCYISWSPCFDCAQELVEFLGENSHVSLRIFAARIYKKRDRNKHIYTTPDKYEDGLRKLRDAGAQLTIMTLKDRQHCWDTFVDNQGQPFQPWTELEKSIGAQCKKLENILMIQDQGN